MMKLYYIHAVLKNTEPRNVDQSEVQILLHSKNIHRIYGRIAGNQLPGHVLLFFTGTRKIISHGRIGKSKVVLLKAA